MPLVPTDGTLLSLDQMAGLVSVEGDEVTVRAGTRLGDLGPALAAHGRAMANLPDINKQSLGGALATATHGTGKHLPAIHGTVTALRLVTPQGLVIDCDATKNKDVFDAARVSIGSLGIITQARLKTVPNKNLHRRVWLEPFEETLAQAESRWNAHRNYEFYAVPFTGLAANITHDETDEAPRPRGPETDSQFLDALKMLRNVFEFSTPLRKRVARFVLTAAEPKAEEAVDEGWKLLSTERPVRFNEMEFHVPAEEQFTALREVVAAIEKNRPGRVLPHRASPHRARRCVAVAVPGRRARLDRGALLLQGRIRIPLHAHRADPAPPRRPSALGKAEFAEDGRLRRALSALERFRRPAPPTRPAGADAQSVFEGCVRSVIRAPTRGNTAKCNQSGNACCRTFPLPQLIKKNII